MFKKKVKSLALVLVAGLTLAACGAEEKKSESAQGVTEDSVTVGNTAAISGAYAPVGAPYNAGIKAYFDKVNETGGINNRKIKFVHQDDEFDPAKGKAALQSLVEDEKVFALVGHFGTPVVAATLDDIQEYGIPAVYFATGIGQLYNEKAEEKEKVLFPVQPIYITEGEMMVSRGVGNFDAKKIGIIYTNDDAGKDMLTGAEKKAKELGVELVSEQVSAGATDVSAAVTSILKAKPDFLIGASIQATFPTIAKALAAQGNEADVITSYVNVDASVADQVWKDIEGKFEVLGNGWVDIASPESVKNLTEMNEWLEADYQNNVYAMTGWIAASFFVEGLDRVGDKALTWENYIEAMESAPINNPFGGEIDYANGQRIGTQEMNLSKIISASEWTEVEPLTGIAEILGK
ncbi:ABC transporter substrate-binding protein [Vagococcus salmoninarum]|uniref:Leucine-binding protein domain-containing protein n=1 Tax=Vagococcus salmoninarum TaxID=2739 RepID=A0A429ZVM4_9ENTE|nr:ABC transporter substrate-binding protein [Vagococcus salmoninarum]RST97839.1 hypothetical protein CBF35_00675 [Vagococcus salmoninarum]